MQKQNIIYSSIEWLTSNECVEHIKSSLRLIHRNHVAGLVNSKESEIIDSLNCTVASPLSVIGSLELLLLGPVELVSPFLTTPKKEKMKKKMSFLVRKMKKRLLFYFQLQMKS